MTHSSYLKNYPPLHLYVSYLTHNLLLKSETLEVDYIEALLFNVIMKKSTIEKSYINLEIAYQSNDIYFLANIESGIYQTKNFLLFIKNQVFGRKQSILEIDIVYKKESPLTLELMSIKDYSLDSQIKSYFKGCKLFKNPKLIIEPLSKMSLNEAIILQMKILKPANKYEKETLLASLDKHNHQEVYTNSFISTMNYWVMKDMERNCVIGLTGLYQEPSDNTDECWVGWFCVDPVYRGKGYGKKLFDFTMKKAQNTGKKYLHIYTYNSKKFQPAINMYKKQGFVEYSPNRLGTNKDMYFKKFIGDSHAA